VRTDRYVVLNKKARVFQLREKQQRALCSLTRGTFYKRLDI